MIEPPRGWLKVRLGELWEFRDLFFTLSWREIQVRYKQTVLGGLWALIQPVATAAAFTLVFRSMIGDVDGTPYVLFAYAGVLLWHLVASVITSGAMSMVDNAPLITKVFFPRLLVPLSVLGYALLDFALGSVVLVIMMIYFGVAPGFGLLLLPLAILGSALCALGAAILLAALTIRYRDFRFVVPFLVQMWFFLSPVIYPTSKAGATIGSLLAFNPMSGWLQLFRATLLGTAIDAQAILAAAITSLVLMVVAVAYFHRVEVSFADVI